MLVLNLRTLRTEDIEEDPLKKENLDVFLKLIHKLLMIIPKTTINKNLHNFLKLINIKMILHKIRMNKILKMMIEQYYHKLNVKCKIKQNKVNKNNVERFDRN